MGKYDGLKAEIERMKKQARKDQQLVSGLSMVTREMQTHAVPAKKRTKGKRAHENTFDQQLRGVPGGRGGIGFLKMCEAEHTGTKTMSHEDQKRLGLIKSAQNSNTTSTQHDAKVRGLIR